MKPFLPQHGNRDRKSSGTALKVAFPLVVLAAAVSAAAETDRLPNVVVILADDLGYGDVKCLNAKGKIATPRIDRLAAEGMIFSDAHSGSGVCTPTRYGLLTGRYAWRSKLKESVLWGYSRPLIELGRLTIAQLAKKHGYVTGCVGKWHLGLDIPLKGGGIADDRGQFLRGYAQAWDVDYAGKIERGPNALGFDYFFGVGPSLDMPPFVFIENDRFTAVPRREKKIVRPGPAADDFEGVTVLPTLTEKALAFINAHAAEARDGQPLFLYFPLTAPHDPIEPTDAWRGKSGLNVYADFVMQLDDTVGRVVDALKAGGIADNTLVIVTSDNGCSPVADFRTLAAKGHHPSYVFRGCKADVYEGGHRVPFVVRWPGKVKAGTKSDQVICLTDLMATFAEIVGAKLPESAGEDSVSILPALVGEAKSQEPLREAIVHHSINGSFAIRQGNWKLSLCGDSGGWSTPMPGSREAVGLPSVQLYDLAADLGERRNVYREHPEIVGRLTALLEKYVAEGRSTPGARQVNTTPVSIRP
ncbi:MAG TPA: arylsulfatase [Pirellulales bacterium]|jgi:arylsulfatase A-like enzyme|nr:arylsulfatase [Pirellulales bacterium]